MYLSDLLIDGYFLYLKTTGRSFSAGHRRVFEIKTFTGILFHPDDIITKEAAVPF